MIFITSSFSLLVIVSGMFLLAKTQKDNLSNFFKYVSYFVIIVGFLNLFFGGVHMLMRSFHQHYAAEMHHGKKYKHGKHKRDKVMIYKNMSCDNEMINEDHHQMSGNYDCEMEKEKCMKTGMMEGKSCCKEKMIIKKDTLIIKK
jgi:hypothetical protein